MLPDWSIGWTKYLACPDCRSEAFHDWHGPDFYFTVRHSTPCPRWPSRDREVRFDLPDMSPGRVGPNGIGRGRMMPIAWPVCADPRMPEHPAGALGGWTHGPTCLLGAHEDGQAVADSDVLADRDAMTA
jgi:hypothetical protein